MTVEPIKESLSLRDQGLGSMIIFRVSGASFKKLPSFQELPEMSFKELPYTSFKELSSFKGLPGVQG